MLYVHLYTLYYYILKSEAANFNFFEILTATQQYRKICCMEVGLVERKREREGEREREKEKEPCTLATRSQTTNV